MSLVLFPLPTGFLAAYTGPAKQAKVGNLHPRKKYKFRLTASNIQGRSRPSEVAEYATQPDAPHTPPAPSLLGDPTPYSLTLSLHAGDANIEEAGDELEFVLEGDAGQREAAAAGIASSTSTPLRTAAKNAAPSASPKASAAAQSLRLLYQGKKTTFTLSELQPGMRYSVRLACRSKGGQSSWSPVSRFTTLPVPCSAPSAPNLLGEPQAQALSLQWQPPAEDGGSSPSIYKVEMLKDDQWQAVYSGSRPDCAVQGLQPFAHYQFRVLAQNRAGVSLGDGEGRDGIVGRKGKPGRLSEKTCLQRLPMKGSKACG